MSAGSCARRVDGGFHSSSGGLIVAIQIELQRDARGVPSDAGRRHLRDAGDAAELALQRSGTADCHRSGTGTQGACRDPDCR